MESPFYLHFFSRRCEVGHGRCGSQIAWLPRPHIFGAEARRARPPGTGDAKQCKALQSCARWPRCRSAALLVLLAHWFATRRVDDYVYLSWLIVRVLRGSGVDCSPRYVSRTESARQWRSNGGACAPVCRGAVCLCWSRASRGAARGQWGGSAMGGVGLECE